MPGRKSKYLWGHPMWVQRRKRPLPTVQVLFLLRGQFHRACPTTKPPTYNPHIVAIDASPAESTTTQAPRIDSQPVNHGWSHKRQAPGQGAGQGSFFSLPGPIDQTGSRTDAARLAPRRSTRTVCLRASSCWTVTTASPATGTWISKFSTRTPSTRAMSTVSSFTSPRCTP